MRLKFPKFERAQNFAKEKKIEFTLTKMKNCEIQQKWIKLLFS